MAEVTYMSRLCNILLQYRKYWEILCIHLVSYLAKYDLDNFLTDYERFTVRYLPSEILCVNLCVDFMFNLTDLYKTKNY